MINTCCTQKRFQQASEVLVLYQQATTVESYG
jgi:hypothetical protein